MIDLNEMEEVCEAATPGPWLMHGGTNRIDAPVFDDPEADWRVATAIRDEDRKLIARARTWLPALVEELREARTTIECLRQSLAVEIQLVEEALAENERLRALVPSADLLQRLVKLAKKALPYALGGDAAREARSLAWRIEEANADDQPE